MTQTDRFGRPAEGTPRELELSKSIAAHMHAVQAGVSLQIARGRQEAEPKHLRVGMTSALIEAGAFQKILIDKGIITREEFLVALDEVWAAEHARYEDETGVILG